MARVRTRIETHHGAYVRLYGSDKVGNNMFLRGLRVETQAKLNLARNPRRIDTGRLRASIGTTRIRRGLVKGARVGTNVNYAIYVMRGTGIYGPRRTRILPRVKSALRWRGKTGGWIFAKSTKGMRPNNFLLDAIPAAKLG